ncbi:hypothetical protein [Methylobacterium variabile]|uniref:hypothetical protein n=1 Tax=Methylobacterium variabile TaxID=298794 RepID=UPI00069FCD23|nr:hypothetical protein [Methylobacterium variabile]
MSAKPREDHTGAAARLQPKLNPVERIWLYLRERFLSARVFHDYEAILDASCTAWNALAAEPERVCSLANFPYIARINA